MAIMKITALLALAALALAGAPASAQAILLNFSFEEMRKELTDQGVTITKEADTESKTHYLQGKDENGLIFAVYGMECEPEEHTPAQRCTGAEMIASFTLADKTKIDEALDLVDYAAVSDYKGTDGNLKISRYIIFDNGITPGNLKVNIEVFISLANDIWDALDDEELLGK
jgi:hypothetical protein